MLGIIKRNFKYISINSFILLYKVWLVHFWITVSQYGYLIKRRHQGTRESSEEGNQDYS